MLSLSLTRTKVNVQNVLDIQQENVSCVLYTFTLLKTDHIF